MSDIIDRRINGRRKSAANQQRFLRRYKAQIREAVARSVAERSIADAGKGGKLSMPARDLREPQFTLGPGGIIERILPGNETFSAGDRIARPRGGAGGTGGQATEGGESVDDFSFTLSREAFLEIFFEDMALPDLVKTRLARIPQARLHRGGYRNDGTPSNLSIARTLRQSLARRLTLTAPRRQQLALIEERIAAERARQAIDAEHQLPLGEPSAQAATPDTLAALLAERERLLARIAHVPFIDEYDLRYNHRVPQPRPDAQAVMFCLMDVSASMDQARKDLAKRFFILLHLFLTQHYEHIEMVFIRHHTVAAVVDELDFFHARESGGTVVSSALELALQTIQERFPPDEWNIYVAQASDGDNWESDCPTCLDLLLNELLPRVQYYCYVEVDAPVPQSLWAQFEAARATVGHLAMGRIMSPADVYPVLHDLFARKERMAA